MALNTDLSLKLIGNYTAASDLLTRQAPLEYTKRYTWPSGTGADQADLMFTDTRTLGASASEDLDLAASLADGLGNTLTYARIKLILITAASGNTNNLGFSRPAAAGVPLFSAASDQIIIPPGGMLLWAAPGSAIAVTATSADLVTLTNLAGSTSVSYDVVIIGASA